MKAELVPIDRIVPDPQNPRKQDDLNQAEFIASIKTHGIKVPLIVYVSGNQLLIGDGHRRWEAARTVGLAEVPVVIFQHKPDDAELLLIQLTINGHRQSLNPVDEYEAFARLAKLKSWNASQLAANIAVSNAEITRIQAIGKLTPEERQLVRTGKLSKSSAYALTRMEAEPRATFIHKAAAGEISRDELNEQVRKQKANPTLKLARLSLPWAGNVITVQTPDGIHIGGLLNLLDSLMKAAKKASKDGLDVSTFARVLKDRARVQLETEGATS